MMTALGRWRWPVAKMFRRFGQQTDAAGASGEVNYYKLLGVRKDARLSEIKAKYKTLVKKYHPDVYKGHDKDFYRRVQDAYKVLSSPKRRLEYDASLKSSNEPGSQSSNSDSGEPGEWNDLSDEYKAKATAKDFYNDLNSVNTKREDVEKEHAQFFSKPISTDFGETVVQETEAIANFTKADRARAAFVTAKDQETTIGKILHHDKAGFDETLKETIEILNEDTKPKRKARLLAMAAEKGLRIGITRLLLGAAAFSIVTIFVLGYEVRKGRDKLVEDEQKKMDIKEREIQSKKLKGQMVFD